MIMDKLWGYWRRCCVVILIALTTLYLFTSRNSFLDRQPWNEISSRNKLKSTPQQHIYYLKNHKTGSTTIYSILAEYCRAHELTALMPSDLHINQRPPFHSSQVMIFPGVPKYDMVFTHHVYSEDILTYLHNDTFRFTSLREPLKQFISSFVYFRNNNFTYLSNIISDDPLKTFLENPQKYEANGYSSYTNNRQSMDLGYDLSHGFNDLAYINIFISLTEKRFDLVLITDYFDESLIVLKRKLRWSTSDILYFKKLESNESRQVLERLSDSQRTQHAQVSTADILLYQHFLKRLKEIMSKELGLPEEVKEFQSVLCRVRTFCSKVQNLNAELKIQAGRWTNEFVFMFSKCKWLTLDEILFTKYLKSLYTMRQS
ncbi:galactose-3-O-sulfotransferase 2 [Biomphalaria glabrata]|nr:galactose-3-O-sulfotransferase 2-like [Biomphalaria glabrata]